MPSSSLSQRQADEAQKKQCGAVGRAQSVLPEHQSSSFSSTMKLWLPELGNAVPWQGSDNTTHAKAFATCDALSEQAYT